MSRATKELLWITRNIKRQCKKSYNKAKRLQTEEAWQDYRNMKNNITKLIREAHRKYQNKMFSKNVTRHEKIGLMGTKHTCLHNITYLLFGKRY